MTVSAADSSLVKDDGVWMNQSSFTSAEEAFFCAQYGTTPSKRTKSPGPVHFDNSANKGQQRGNKNSQRRNDSKSPHQQVMDSLAYMPAFYNFRAGLSKGTTETTKASSSMEGSAASITTTTNITKETPTTEGEAIKGEVPSTIETTNTTRHTINSSSGS